MTAEPTVPDHSAFYLPRGDGIFESTAATASPWDESLQHGGPPAGLIARAVEHVRPDPSMQIARITVDMLGGIPKGTVRVEAEVVRPGRRVEMMEARLWVDDRLSVTATAWRIRVDEGTTSEHTHEPEVPALPDPAPQEYFAGVSPDWGYGRAIDWRFVEGGFNDIGPARVWARLRIPLVEGEQTSPAQRLIVVGDSANGLSGELPFTQWLFIPSTTTATIQRPPAGEWIFLDAHTTIGPDGVGLTQAAVLDGQGLCASINQPLLVSPRS